MLSATGRERISPTRGTPVRGTTDADQRPDGHDRRVGARAEDPGVDSMTTTPVDIIDRSVEKAHVWVNATAEELRTEDNHRAYRVLRAFLHALRDHLSVDETAQLSAQLPIFVRGVFYEGWDPSRTPEHARDIDSFLTRIAAEAGWRARPRRRLPRPGFGRLSRPADPTRRLSAQLPRVSLVSG